MTGSPNMRRRLDEALGQSPDPALPTDLAARIVARATALPQQARREETMAAVPKITPVPTRRTSRFRPWLATGIGAALAASAALVVVPQPSVETPPEAHPLTQPAVDAGPVATANTDGSASLASQAPAKTYNPHPVQPDHQPGRRERIEVAIAEAVPAEAPEPAGDASPPAETPAPPASPALAENATPAPIQGPPIPDDLRLGQGESGAVAGYGITGGITGPAVRPFPAHVGNTGPTHQGGTIRR